MRDEKSLLIQLFFINFMQWRRKERMIRKRCNQSWKFTPEMDYCGNLEIFLWFWSSAYMRMPWEGPSMVLFVWVQPSYFFFFFFSSTSLLLPTHLPPPSCTPAQSCNPMDFSPPDSSVHGFFQARILEWVAISFSSHLILRFILACL